MDFDRTDFEGMGFEGMGFEGMGFEGMGFEGGGFLAENLKTCRPTDGFSNGVEGPVGPTWSDSPIASD
jgi:hypothetical protein